MRGVEVSPKVYFFFFDFTQKTPIGQVLPAVSEAKDPMRAQRGGVLVEEAAYRGGTDSEASEEAEIGAGGGPSGSEEARGIPQSQAKLFVLHLNGRSNRDSHLGDGKAKGG